MNAWLATVVGDTAAPIVGFVLLFALVIVLLLLVFGVLRRVTGGTFVNGGRNRQVRLSVTDAAAVDNRRRLVLVRRDDVEHLILIGGPSDVVIEQNIRQFAKQQSRIEPAAPTIAERETKPEAAAIETPREQPAPRAAPQTQQQPPARGPAASPQPPSAPRPPEPARQQAAPAPLPPIPPITPVPASEPVRTPAYFPAATETPLASASSPAVPAEAGNGWERTAAPSFGTRQEPVAGTPAPQTSNEPKATTAAAFPFAARNEPSASAYKEPSLDNSEPDEGTEPELTLADVDFQEAFEADFESELHVVPGKETEGQKSGDIEDEMERLLGDLSKPEKR